MSTNWPLVRLTSGTNVYYAKTSNWNRLGAVQTDSAEDTAYFALPSLPGGNYSVQVVVNGFASSPVPLTTFGVAITATNISSCHGTGSATASASYGAKPYTYSWSPSGGTDSIASGLSAGTYTVTVTEVGGCTTSASVNITQPGNLNLSTTFTSVGCIGGSNGSAIANVSGGTTPYTYSWTGGGTTSTISGLTAGIYTLTVSDSCGLSLTASVNITQPTTLLLSIDSLTNEPCNGDTSGKCNCYCKRWKNSLYLCMEPKRGTNAKSNGLTAGNYTVTA